MKVLVVGGGGREHALCWKLAQSALLSKLYCAPGNPGIAEVAELVPIGADEVDRLADFAAAQSVDLTVIGPELPLTLGLADQLSRRGLAVFGPSRLAAELEGSKVFAKQFMARHGIPTARFTIAHTEEEARSAASELGFPVVLKADGLAAGKGVILPANPEELNEALRLFFAERRFGSSADRVVVEEFLQGQEVSFMALSDGERILPLASARDYKRVGENDTGANTGGMGAHSPSFGLDAKTALEIEESVLWPTIRGLAAEGRRFQGVLYAGLIFTPDGPKVLEFNARFGDPEAQVILLRLQDDLLPILKAGAEGQFTAQHLTFRPEAAVCITLASPGYPEAPATGEPIHGLQAASALPGVQIFHAGTARVQGELLSAGGRVLSICAVGADLTEGLQRAYAAVAKVDWSAKLYRRDIGRKAMLSSQALES